MCDSPWTGCAWRITPIYVLCEQAEIAWARCGTSNIACCHSVKLCALAARPFQSKQCGALTRMWRWCQVQPSQKKNVRQVPFIAKRKGRCCILSVDIALKVWFITNGICAKSNTQIYVTRTSNNRVISLRDLYCCLLPQCEALCTLPLELFDRNIRNILLVFRIPNKWKWPEMKMFLELDLHLATFQYIDGFGCYHFCLKQIRIGIDDLRLDFFATFALNLGLQITVTFGSVLGLQVLPRLQVNSGLQLPAHWEPFVATTILCRPQSGVYNLLLLPATFFFIYMKYGWQWVRVIFLRYV